MKYFHNNQIIFLYFYFYLKFILLENLISHLRSQIKTIFYFAKAAPTAIFKNIISFFSIFLRLIIFFISNKIFSES